MFKKVAFTLYPVTDIKRARNFYENILGLTVGKISDEGFWIEYDLPEGGCLVITSMPDTGNPSADFGGSIAIEVENLDELVFKLNKLGVQFKAELFATPVCRMAVVLDSEGNALTLHQLK